MRISVDRIRKVSAQKLRREYEQLSFHDDESIKDFAMWLTSLTNQLATLGDPEADNKVIAKYLHVVRPRYRQFVVSIEALLDIMTLSVEEVTARLKAVEDDGVTIGNRDDDDMLYLIEEEWLEHFKQKESDRGHCSGSSDGGGSGTRGKKADGKKGGNGSNSNEDRAGPLGRGKDKCRACDKIGQGVPQPAQTQRVGPCGRG
jgi:DnaJ-domain-containing protein 1